MVETHNQARCHGVPTDDCRKYRNRLCHTVTVSGQLAQCHTFKKL